jgi:hypothetical protein
MVRATKGKSARFVDGVSLDEAMRRLIMEHRFARINERHEELHADPAESESYRAEFRLTDNAAGDALPDAREECREYKSRFRPRSAPGDVINVAFRREQLCANGIAMRVILLSD